MAINLLSGQELWGLETNEPLLSRPSSFHGLWKTLRAGLKLNFDKGKCSVYPVWHSVTIVFKDVVHMLNILGLCGSGVRTGFKFQRCAIDWDFRQLV